MRSLILIALLAAAGCSSPSPLSPSTSAAPPPVVVAPPVPPAPVFPALTGTWTGTFATILAAETPNYSLTQVCGATWTIFTQTQDRFTGDLLLSGGPPEIPCGGGLRLTGGVTVAGAVGVDRAWPFDDAACSLKATQNLSGTMTGAHLNLTQKDTWLCPPYLINRTILVALTKP